MNKCTVDEVCFVGGQLWERVEAGRFSEAQAARIIREIMQLLAQAHSRNIVIRDIKPDNLLFLDHSEDAPLKAIDFGIATICTPDDVLEERCGKPCLQYVRLTTTCLCLSMDVCDPQHRLCRGWLDVSLLILFSYTQYFAAVSAL